MTDPKGDKGAATEAAQAEGKRERGRRRLEAVTKQMQEAALKEAMEHGDLEAIEEMMISPTPRKVVRLPAEVLARVDAYRRASPRKRIPSEAQALRELIELGLDAVEAAGRRPRRSGAEPAVSAASP